MQADFARFLLGDFELPAQKARSEFCVRAAFADDDGEVAFGDFESDFSFARVDFDVLGDCGLNAFFEKHLRIGGEFDYVDFLAAELADNAFDSRAARADACAHGVDARIVAGNGNLRTVAGFARHCLDAHRAVRDFGDFKLEKLFDELVAGAA